MIRIPDFFLNCQYSIPAQIRRWSRPTTKQPTGTAASTFPTTTPSNTAAETTSSACRWSSPLRWSMRDRATTSPAQATAFSAWTEWHSRSQSNTDSAFLLTSTSLHLPPTPSLHRRKIAHRRLSRLTATSSVLVGSVVVLMRAGGWLCCSAWHC